MSDLADNLATVVLTLTVLSPLLMAWGFSRRSQLTFAQTLVWMPAAMLTLFLWKTRLHGRINQISDGAILIANHRSSVDPFFIQMVCDKPVGCMIAREYTNLPLLRPIFRFLDVIPAGRKGIDSQATKRAIREAANGRWILMFPEGRLNISAQLMQPSRPGAIMIAIRAGVPVVPCYLQGVSFTDALLNPFYSAAQVTLHVGQPIDVADLAKGNLDKKTLARITRICLREIGKLAGQPEWEPELAGRQWLQEPVESTA